MILLILPFKSIIAVNVLVWSKWLSVFFNHCDEITIGISLPLAIREFYRNREVSNSLYFILLCSLLVFIIVNVISGMKNANQLLVTALGTLDYIKYFLVLFIYGAFFKEMSEFKKIFRYMVVIAVFIGIIAIVQEIWTLSAVYILKKDITDHSVYILRGMSTTESLVSKWRFGIFRAPSLMMHPANVGLYSLLILTVYLCLNKKINKLYFCTLMAGIYISVSRIVYLGFMFIAGLLMFKGRKWLIVFILVPVLIAGIFMTTLPDFHIAKVLEISTTDAATEIPYRTYSRGKAIEIWKDHPLWGVGPGMFGGNIAARFSSYVYEEYNFQTNWFFSRYWNLDQFWPQLLAESGIIGLMAFIGLFASVLAIILAVKQNSRDDEIKSLSSGLLSFAGVILIYATAYIFNLSAIIFSYFAFVGILLGCYNKKIRDSKKNAKESIAA